MTTIQQQIDFVQGLRDKWDGSQRERIAIAQDPQTVAKLLRDIEENLIGVRNWQLGKPSAFCGDCNTALNESNRVNYAVSEGNVIVTRDEHVCERCTELRIEKMKNTTAGIP